METTKSLFSASVQTRQPRAAASCGHAGCVGLGRCATPDPTPDELGKIQRDFKQAFDVDGKKPLQGGVIDVYVHVLNRAPGGEGDISQELIDRQLRVLNDAYAKTGWSFRVVDVDRTSNTRWYRAHPNTPSERAMKTALRKGDADDLNLYISSTYSLTGIIGWATPPWAYEQNPLMDGVVIHNETLPGSALPTDEGDTAVHEVGHWMGLFHTFQGGCDAPGDHVDDTPAEGEPAFGRPKDRDTCPDSPGLDPVHNYMDYVDDGWMHEFTPGQDLRADQMFTLYRRGTPPEAVNNSVRPGNLFGRSAL